jgi:PadR family transcriptional regulator PadR
MNGVPELLILRLLRSREMYGYEIVQAIREETGEVVALGEGVVYPLLHALEGGGALTSRRQTVNGRSRIYYALSERGASRLTELAGVWSRLTQALQQVMKGDGYAEGV